jgi:hypothetical protein
MNIPLFNFCLFLLWFGVAITSLVIGPIAYPETFKDSGFIGVGAALLAAWNFVKWWILWHNERARAYRREMEELYRKRINPPEEKKDPQIVCPEFQFENDARKRISPPDESANGK